MMTPCKIGVLQIILSPGGGAWSVARELAQWQRADMPVAVGISHRHGQSAGALREAEDLGFKLFTHTVPVDFPNASALLLPPLHRWHAALRCEDPAVTWVTHFHNGSGIGFAFWPSLSARPRYPWPAINTFHGIAPEEAVPELRGRFGGLQCAVSGWLTRQMHRVGVQLTTLSLASRREIASIHHVPETAIWVVPNGVPACAKPGCPRLRVAGPFRVGFVGHLGPKKRWDVALQAVRLLHDEGKDVQLTLVGHGPDAERVRTEAQRSGAFVSFLGAVAQAGQTVMPTLDALVLPAHHEGQPMVILEALACGVPTIATAVGAIPETIEHGETGFLIEQPSAVDMARHLRTLIDHPDLHRRISGNCLQAWQQRFSVATMAQRYAEVYDAAIARYGRPLNL
jgi:glycosyltransferase involved in cell wall biosynthesis